MYRIFLVEDESIIRETLRDNMPWAQCGYTFVGEAGDGELALSQIRQLKPDVVLTDIRMPFMDGLDLSRILKREFPQMKIIVLSGYDDFEYARQALNIGVEQYLLKPVTKNALMEVLAQVREKIDQERAQQNYQTQFRQETQEYEDYARRNFIERVVAGQMPLQQIYEQAAELGLDLRAQSYTLAFFSIQPEKSDLAQQYSEPTALVRDGLLAHFLKYPEYLLIRWNLTTYAVLIMADVNKMQTCVERCIRAVQTQYEKNAPNQNWYIAVGEPTLRLSMLGNCFRQLQCFWAYRLLRPSQHILTKETVGQLMEEGSYVSLQELDVSKVEPAIFRGVIETASADEIREFVEEYLRSVESVLDSNPFCQYLMLSVQFTATAYLGELKIQQKELMNRMKYGELIGQRVTVSDLRLFLTDVLTCAVNLRDQCSSNQYRSILKQAAGYIDSHFAEEKLSLNQVAREINISPNYLSAMFSQEMGCTFVEYITGKRMELARELLRNTDQRSGEIAAAVGYRDPHYFSFLFKKTQGCTPRDFRSGGGKR